ncbi:hypothetical protein OG618_37505 (plasmid) [Kitasatospora sp. NBC_01246]|uniref:hypothetical protein n=1 Tax=Kitasatospora sp. NBC_01246 TaxID=2903570 RepID=UPI002E36DA96|nr:hypothetical protein [Kitasatospora sp. NBC_01246]
MTTIPDQLNPPARRRRNARLLLALAELVGACAEAAAEVYRTIAAAPPTQQALKVSPLACVQVSYTAAPLLEAARQEDDVRWPNAVARERAQSLHAHAARCAVARATDFLEGPAVLGVPVPTAEQGAAMALAEAGSEVAALWRDDPEQAVARVRELAAGGELVPDEILDAATEDAVTIGLLALQGVRGAAEPSIAAERCLGAVPYFALAVTLAGVDLD